MERKQIKHKNILMTLKRNMACTKIMHPVSIYIFNVISGGDDASAPWCYPTCCSHPLYTFVTVKIFSVPAGWWCLHTTPPLMQCIRRHRGVVLMISLQEALTSPSCRVLSDRGRKIRPEWKSLWQAHRSKTGKCQTPSARRSFYSRPASVLSQRQL